MEVERHIEDFDKEKVFEEFREIEDLKGKNYKLTKIIDSLNNDKKELLIVINKLSAIQYRIYDQT